MQFGTKAETLGRIYNRLSYASVLPQISFRVKEWKSSEEKHWQQCVKTWGEAKVIVRSSAINEDTKESSQAGKFESISNVALCDREICCRR